MKNIKVKVGYSGLESNKRFIKTDRKRLQQVLLNLYSNAVKFTNRDGKISIMVELLKQRHKEFVRVSVHDSGIGIKEEDKNKLFTLFGSIKDEKRKINTKGIGLGLVICKMIVHKFGGDIDFVSE